MSGTGIGKLTVISFRPGHIVVRQDDWPVFDGRRRGDCNFDVSSLIVRPAPEKQAMGPKGSLESGFERRGFVQALVADKSQPLEGTRGECLGAEVSEPHHALCHGPVFHAEPECDDSAGAGIRK